LQIVGILADSGHTCRQWAYLQTVGADHLVSVTITVFIRNCDVLLRTSGADKTVGGHTEIATVCLWGLIFNDVTSCTDILASAQKLRPLVPIPLDTLMYIRDFMCYPS
jgi:hypothetical protein